MTHHPLLTKPMHKVLTILVNNDDYIIAGGLEVWAGDYKTSRLTLNKLLRLCLVKEDSITGGTTEIYWATEEAKKMLDDVNYTPQILKLL